MMMNFKSTSGVEVQLYNGVIHFWMSEGVYSLRSSTLRRHGQYHGPRTVTLLMLDVETMQSKPLTIEYPESFDDYEIIYRWLMGTGNCDCIRGSLFYSPATKFRCNRGPNRFILQKMVIMGENLNCIVKYRGFM
jgi:hypothetical protein